MISASWKYKELTDFDGAWPLLEQSDIPSQGALFARNVEFVPGIVKVRKGFSSVANPNAAIAAGMSWVFSDPSTGAHNFMPYFKTGYGVVLFDLSNNSSTNLYTSTGVSATFANAGPRFYAAHFDTSAIGVDGGKVYGYLVGADNLFARPMKSTEVTLGAVVAAGGVCTQGTRNVAFVMTTRNGFQGRPSPVDTSMVIVPTSVTTTNTNKKFTVTVTPATTWPAYSGTIQILMTSTSNNSRYYVVPGSILAVPAGGSFAVTFVVSISDDDLTFASEDATPFFSRLTQNLSDVAPFYPHCLFESGNRMFYLVKSGLFGMCYFASDPNNYQSISADQHIRYLPGQKEVNSGFYLDGVTYLCGPHWTYGVVDNGYSPVTWYAERVVDGSIGTFAPHGTAVNATQGFGWVADVNGLYRFSGGRYDSLPASYYQTPEWKKINWAAAWTVQVRDWAERKLVCVNAPMMLTGTVNTNGTAITWVSGDKFATAWTNGTEVIVNGVSKVIASVASETSMTLTASAGIQASVIYTAKPTYCTHMLTWNYMQGTSADRVKYALMDLKSFNPAALIINQNNSTKKQELWLGSAAAGPILRANDGTETNVYRDLSDPIAGQYRTTILPGLSDSRAAKLMLHGGVFRIYGIGSALMQADSIDYVHNRTLNPIPLQLNPGALIGRGMTMITPSGSLLITNGGVLDSYWELSLLRWYYSDFAFQP